MEEKSDYIEDLRVIKKVMEESSRFLSLSGLSGVFAGIIALLGGVAAYIFFFDGQGVMSAEKIYTHKTGLGIDALLVLVFAITVSLYFSFRKSVRKGIGMWTPVSKRLLINLLVPLATGGIFIIILCFQHNWQLIIPSMLIFYGIALVNAGKFTYNEVFYLGLSEILTGLFSAIAPSYGLFFWAFGFGILHMAYGLILFRKYEG
jgi:hypothetical protein